MEENSADFPQLRVQLVAQESGESQGRMHIYQGVAE
jgi:hypothetical protein